MRPFDDLRRRLFEPVDIASLVFFRIAFGAIMTWEVLRYFDHGWIRRYYIEPTFHFTYPGFGWVHPWPGWGMYAHFAGLGVLALCILAGLRYRITSALFFLGFTYVFLLDEANYLNHFYLIVLLSFLMTLLPAGRALSRDAERNPAIRTDAIPAWPVWLLRAQLTVVYFFGGVAKMNRDWLTGEPMRMWLARETDFPVIGPLFTQEWVVYLFSYGGLALDLLVPFFLFARKTRPFAFAFVVLFHLLNAKLFRIGIFPWFMIAATTIYFSPGWPRRLVRHAALSAPRLAESVSPAWQKRTLAFLGTWLAIQVLVPLRHHVYPGNVSWTEEGHCFSWHMKLRDKRARNRYWVTDPDVARTWEVDPDDFLSDRQVRKMSTRPRMIVEFAHHVEEEMRKQGHDDVEVRVDSRVSLNSRSRRPLIDPDVDLTRVRCSFPPPASWILPLDPG